MYELEVGVTLALLMKGPEVICRNRVLKNT
jgi:hypothetical protein